MSQFLQSSVGPAYQGISALIQADAAQAAQERQHEAQLKDLKLAREDAALRQAEARAFAAEESNKEKGFRTASQKQEQEFAAAEAEKARKASAEQQTGYYKFSEKQQDSIKRHDEWVMNKKMDWEERMEKIRWMVQSSDRATQLKFMQTSDALQQFKDRQELMMGFGQKAVEGRLHELTKHAEELQRKSQDLRVASIKSEEAGRALGTRLAENLQKSYMQRQSELGDTNRARQAPSGTTKAIGVGLSFVPFVGGFPDQLRDMSSADLARAYGAGEGLLESLPTILGSTFETALLEQGQTPAQAASAKAALIELGTKIVTIGSMASANDKDAQKAASSLIAQAKEKALNSGVSPVLVKAALKQFATAVGDLQTQNISKATTEAGQRGVIDVQNQRYDIIQRGAEALAASLPAGQDQSADILAQAVTALKGGDMSKAGAVLGKVGDKTLQDLLRDVTEAQNALNDSRVNSFDAASKASQDTHRRQAEILQEQAAMIADLMKARAGPSPVEAPPQMGSVVGAP